MRMVNRTCNYCGENFHYCSNCNFDIYAEKGFCSKLCYVELDPVSKGILKDMKTFYEDLNEEQQVTLWRVLEKVKYNNGVSIEELKSVIMED